MSGRFRRIAVINTSREIARDVRMMNKPLVYLHASFAVLLLLSSALSQRKKKTVKLSCPLVRLAAMTTCRASFALNPKPYTLTVRPPEAQNKSERPSLVTRHHACAGFRSPAM